MIDMATTEWNDGDEGTINRQFKHFRKPGQHDFF
jgi:hypothetical protein